VCNGATTLLPSIKTDTKIDRGSVGSATGSPSLRSAPRLYDDLIVAIIEQLYYAPSLLPDWSNFARYALVATSWRIPVQRLLFHEVNITNTDAKYEALRKAVDPSTEHGRLLQKFVRILNYTMSPNSVTIPPYKATTWEKRFPVALKLFPYLYELRLNIDAVYELSPSIISALGDGTPPIRALQIGMRPHPRRFHALSIVPLQLLHISPWPLEAIVFRGEQWAPQAFANFPPVKHQFYEVRWLCPEPSADSVKPFLKYLTSNSSKSLQILHVPQVDHVLPVWAPTLRSILLTGANSSILQQLPQLPLLRDLVIAPTTYRIDVETQLSTLATLPPKLEHVGFTMAYEHITFSTLKQAIVSMPQTLRVLSIYSSSIPAAAAQADAKKAVERIQSQDNFPNVRVHLYEGPIPSRIGQVRRCLGPFTMKSDGAASGPI
jgi:hypothetical protein